MKAEARTFTFANFETGHGFQIFVTPTSDKQITEARILQDIPSGVHTDFKEIIVDGAQGVAFYGSDDSLGEGEYAATREIWFIRGNYLYEVTAPKHLEAWLGDIVKSWKFL